MKAASLVLCVLLTTVSAYSQQTQNGPVNSLHVQGSVYMLVGAGGNIAVQANKDGVLLVDTGLPQMTDQVLAAVKEISKPITNRPLRFILNTHFHADHSGGNEKIRAAGTTITGGNVAGNISDATEGAAIYAHENVMKRMSAPSGSQARRRRRLAHRYFFGYSQELFSTARRSRCFIEAGAHRQGQHRFLPPVRRRAHGRHLHDPTKYPIIDLKNGGSLAGCSKGSI